MTQYARPDSDIDAGGWVKSTGSYLYECIDEESQTNDYIRATGNDTSMTCKLGLSTIDTPGDGDVIITYAILTVGSGTKSIYITPYLYEGATLRATGTEYQCTGSTTNRTYTLSSGEKAAISDWSDLRIWFTCRIVGSDGNLSGAVVQAFISAPDEASGVSGSASFTLSPFTLSGAGTVEIDGEASFALSSFALSGTGSVAIAGEASFTLSPVTLSGTGSAGSTPIAGEASFTLSPVTLDAAGSIAIEGEASVELTDFVLAGSGQVTVTGEASFTLGGFALDATGQVAIEGQGIAELTDFVLAGVGSVGITGTLAETLAAFTLDGQGYTGGLPPVTGEAAFVLGAFVISIQGTTPEIPQNSRQIAMTLIPISVCELTIENKGILTCTIAPTAIVELNEVEYV